MLNPHTWPLVDFRYLELEWRERLGLHPAATWADLKHSTGRAIPGILLRVIAYILSLLCMFLLSLVMGIILIGDALDQRLGARATIRSMQRWWAPYNPPNRWTDSPGED